MQRPLGATSTVIFELKPFGVSIMGANGSQPWVGRSTVQMSGNPTTQQLHTAGPFFSNYHHDLQDFLENLMILNIVIF